MSVLARLLGVEQRAYSLADLDALMDGQLGGTASGTGIWVDAGTAMTSAVVYACVNVLAQTIASLPLLVYRRLPSGGKERSPEHRLYSILHDAPNPEMTSYEFRACLVGHVCLWGNAYAEIEMSDAGINGLWPLRPDRMTPARNEAGELVYDYRLPSGQTKRFRFQQIMHWRGLSSNGIIGYSPIQQAAEAIGLDLATRQYGAKFFGNDSRPGGILTHPNKLSPDAAKRLKASWEDAHRGLSNSQRVAVLEEGVQWTAIGIPPEQAQFLETRRYGRAEIAALYRVPLHLINDLERATFSNIEHQSLEFVQYSLVPWLVQIEQGIKRDLFRISDGKRTHFAEHLVDGLLRGDVASRFGAYQVARQNGWLNANEIRMLENLNPIPGEEGSTYLWPANMTPAQVALKPPEPPQTVGTMGATEDTEEAGSQNGNSDDEGSQNGNMGAGDEDEG